MKKLLTGAIALFTTTSLMAGTGSHGGDGLICFNNISSKITVQRILEENSKTIFASDPFADEELLNDISQVRLLDLYLAELKLGYEADIPNITDEEKMIRHFSNKIRAKSSFFKSVEKARELLDDGGWYSNPGAVLEINDSGHIIIFPKNCLLVQLAAQDLITDSLSKVYYDQRIMNKMSLRDKVALMFHEWIYYIAIKNGNTDSRGVQDMVSLLFSKEFTNYSSEFFNDKLYDTGILKQIRNIHEVQETSFFGKKEKVVFYESYKKVKDYTYNTSAIVFVDSPKTLKFQGKDFVVKENYEYNKQSDQDIESYTFTLNESVVFTIQDKEYLLVGDIGFKYNSKTKEAWISNAQLEGDYEIEGYRVYKSLNTSDNNKKIQSILFEDIVYAQNTINKDTAVYISEDTISFYTGQLDLVFSNGKEEKISCYGNVIFYKDSKKLQSCTLVEDFKTQTYVVGKNNKIEFYKDGSIKFIGKSKGYSYNDGWYTGDIAFYNNGKIKEAYLSNKKSVLVDNIPCEQGNVKYSESGKLLSCQALRNTPIEVLVNNKQLIVNFSYNSYQPKVSRIKFFETTYSLVKGCVKQEEKTGFFGGSTDDYKPLVLDGVKFGKKRYSSCTEIVFHESGIVKSGILYEDTIIDGRPYKEGTWLEFDKDGHIVN